LFWNFLEQASAAGISRLVLFPIVAYLVGKDEFGLFATALSFALIVGINPANGLAIGLLRNLSHYQDQQQKQLISTAVRMCHKFQRDSRIRSVNSGAGVNCRAHLHSRCPSAGNRNRIHNPGTFIQQSAVRIV